MSPLLDVLARLHAALAERYTIERELGRGGMATVYLAHDKKHDRAVAIKVLRPELAASVGAERFVREIQIAAQLQHPHVLPLHDSGQTAGLLYYVMPYVEGESLRDKLKRDGALPIDDTVRMLGQIVDALAYAHAHGFVHRDIKPENVMLSGRHALVTDFGVAKAVSDAAGQPTLTTVGIALGTPAYMAPEQAVADPHVDHRADIYSVGAVAYEMLTGQPPFMGDTPQSVLAAHVTATPAPVTRHREDVPAALAEIVMRCLAKRPLDRWQSANDVLARLETVVPRTGARTPRLWSTIPVMVVALLALAVTAAGIVATVPAFRSVILGRQGSTIPVPQNHNPVALPVQATGGHTSTVIPYWSLSALNLAVLVVLAASLLALDRRSATVRAFATILVLRGLVGVTATLGDGAPFAIARWAVPLDAALSTLLSGALAIFVLLYPNRRAWAGRLLLGAIALVTLVLAGIALAVPSALGVLSSAPDGTLTVASLGPLLWERAAYIGAIAVSAAVLAVEHARLARPELRRSVLLLGIALATFPIDVGATIVGLPPSVARAAFVPYGGTFAVVLVLVSGTIGLGVALAFVVTELRHGDRRAAVGSLLACGIAAASGLVGARFGAAPTVAGSVSFVMRGVWRFPLPILATYAVLRHQLLGIDVRLKWTIRRGTLAAIFLAAFLIVAQLIQNVANARLGYLVGAIAAGLLLFALAPLQRFSQRFADAALPRVRDPRAAPPARRLDAYRQTAELLLADGVLTSHKERALAALADELGISAVAALEVRQRALSRPAEVVRGAADS